MKCLNRQKGRREWKEKDGAAVGFWNYVLFWLINDILLNAAEMVHICGCYWCCYCIEQLFIALN